MSYRKAGFIATIAAIFVMTTFSLGVAQSLDPLALPKYVTPLVIPPVMKTTGPANMYDIAVRQFQQQILPAGFPTTTVWSYGPTADLVPAVAAPDPASQFNYPAYTIETIANTPVSVRWVNDLVDTNGNYLPHLLPLDQTLHWANPPAIGCVDGTNRTDCTTDNPAAYEGPVPIVTHVHGAHVDPHSDGYPEAWYLPAANNIPAGYATSGTIFDDSKGNPGNLGYADYLYRQDQPATTLWYHDHSLGITRANVYAGPAGFWLIRGGAYDSVIDGKKGGPALLPAPAPVAGETVLDLNTPGNPVRSKIREIPVVIQDRSFNTDGSLFYPDTRAFFDGFEGPYIPDPVPNFLNVFSDISPVWNPEAFFNTMVVNGVTWPTIDVAPARYRLRLLNGCNSRFLNLALVYDTADPNKTKELPFFQIGAEQGFLPRVAEILMGFATPLAGDGTKPKPGQRVPAADPQQALLMGLAERADVIVDFEDLPDGTRIRMINTAPDAPFGGFPDIPADPATTGQVIEFVVNSALLLPSDENTTSPYRLVLNAEPGLGTSSVTRQVSLNEEESLTVCVDANNIVIPDVLPPDCGGLGLPAAPRAALLGEVDLTGAAPAGSALKWTDDTSPNNVPAQITLQSGAVLTVNVTENPTLGSTETWEIYNFTADAHPIHLHLVRFEVIDREVWDPLVGIPGTIRPREAWETGYKDTVISYPGEITRVKALFDIEGLYVWHCHILEHEDNEMMRPYVVSSQ